ncbi:MAG: hypothetical protein M3552_06855 [Planctomycetota bacterium]|nr:hypothetical protein [Planctomycetota bacterium]
MKPHPKLSAESPPFERVGAGRLTAALRREPRGDAYRISLTSDAASDEGVALSPSDVPDLVSLARVLAAVLTDDGGLPRGLHAELSALAEILNELPRRPLSVRGYR